MDRLPNPLLALFHNLAGDAGSDIVEHSPWRAPFEAKGVQGTFVLWEPLAQRYRVADARRARKGYLPHATFDAAGALVKEVSVFRTEVGDFNAASIQVPEPEPGWHSIQVTGAPPIVFAHEP